MNRAVWKWIFGITLALLVILVLYFICAAAIANFAGATYMYMLEGVTPVEIYTLQESLKNSVGSAWFYAVVTDITMMTISVIALIATRKRKR